MYIYTLDGPALPSAPHPTTILMGSKCRAGLNFSFNRRPGKDFISKTGSFGPDLGTGQLKFRESQLSRSLSPTFTWCSFPTVTPPKGCPVCMTRHLPPLGQPMSFTRWDPSGKDFVLFTSSILVLRTVPGTYCCINEWNLQLSGSDFLKSHSPYIWIFNQNSGFGDFYTLVRTTQKNYHFSGDNVSDI